MKKQNQSLLPFSATLLLLLLVSILCSTTLATISPAKPPIQSTPPTTAPTTPLVPTLPQPPSDTPPDTSGATVDIIGILKKANSFNIFIRLMKTTQLINQLNSQLLTIKSGGLTILSPDDSAFSELKPGFLNSLSDGQKLELLQFHVIPDFVSSSNFDTLTNPVRTLAGNKPGKVELNVISVGGNVNISTGQVNTTVNGIIYTDKHLAIYKVGKVLLPSEFFPKKTIAAVPSLAPAPAAEAPTPKAAKEKPSPSTEDSSESSSQVVPTVTSSGGVRMMMSKCGSTCVAIVVGVVFVWGFYNIN